MAGCSSTRWGFVKNNDKSSLPSGPNEVPTTAQVVKWMNDNAEIIQTLRVDELTLDCTQGLQTWSVRGEMRAEKPRNFRLGAKALGNPVVDLGSNQQEFWYWLSKADPPYQVYCSYRDLSEVRRMPFPFQPEWVMESMGLGPYGPPEKYQLEHTSDTLKLVEKTTSPQGTPVRKVIVFKRKPVKAPNAQVTDYLLLDDATGKEICGAHITEVQQVQTGGKSALVPRRIALHWPSEKLRLTMRLDETTINVPLPPEVFTRRIMRDVKSFNLARMQVDDTPPPQAFSGGDSRVRPVQALVPSAP
jgi:hypothetical protein